MTQVLRVASVRLGTLSAPDSAHVSAQRSDSCCAAQITGSGTFAFDATKATTGSEAHFEASCLAPPGNTSNVSSGLVAD